MDRPTAVGFLGLTALQAEGCGGGFAADYKVSVTGLALCVIGLDWHSGDWLAALATKGGFHFRRPQDGCMVFPRAKARLLGFIIRGRLL